MTSRPSLRNFSYKTGDLKAQEAAREAHALTAMKTWRKISIYGALPFVCFFGIYTLFHELNKEHVSKPFVAYPYLRIRIKVCYVLHHL
jgi:hypothetical protein